MGSNQKQTTHQTYINYKRAMFKGPIIEKQWTQLKKDGRYKHNDQNTWENASNTYKTTGGTSRMIQYNTHINSTDADSKEKYQKKQIMNKNGLVEVKQKLARRHNISFLQGKANENNNYSVKENSL